MSLVLSITVSISNLVQISPELAEIRPFVYFLKSISTMVMVMVMVNVDLYSALSQSL